jgi:hypothetical protein
MTKPEIVGELKKVGKFIQVAESEMNRLGIYPRKPWMYPFDLVGLATVSKAVALSKACLKLVSSGFPDEAYGLDPRDSHARNYVRHHLADKAFWAHYSLELFGGKPEEKDITYKEKGLLPIRSPLVVIGQTRKEVLSWRP